jgi:riboflavin synthase
MFTGIIHHVSPLQTRSGACLRLGVADPWDDTRVGDSIAVHGVCLTIAEAGDRQLWFDVVPETLLRTNLGKLPEGSLVHLERAMRAGDRFDGHFVQGHVDGTVRVVEPARADNHWRLTLRCPADLLRFVVPKGSVTLNGVSLTVADLQEDQFTVALIPTTLQKTTLGNLQALAEVNFEADILTKSVIFHLERLRQSADTKGSPVYEPG